MSNRVPLKPIAAALMASLITGGPAFASRAIQENVTVSQVRQITPQEEATISSTALKVLRHIADARGALVGDKPDNEKAKAQLEQSEKLLEIIQAALPTSKIKDRIWVAKKHLEYENTQEVLPDLVPIYTSLDELVDYVPTAKAKTHLDNAKQAMEKGDKPKAVEQLQAADDALLYVEADLPLSSTRHLVDQSKAALVKGDFKAADQALKAAEDNVVFVSVSFQSPLTQAKAALYRAGKEYEAGDKDLAKTDLNTAVKYLERAAQSPDKLTRNAAADLVSEVRDLHGLIDTDNKGVATRLEGALQRVKAISERSVEYISTGWQRLRAEGAGKKDLIEAKLHLAYARIDRFNSADDAAAKVDLAEVKGYLDAAAKQMKKPERQAEVQEISSLVTGVEKALKSGDAPHGGVAAFSQAESRLATMIRQL
jgi:ribosomal protein S20